MAPATTAHGAGSFSPAVSLQASCFWSASASSWRMAKAFAGSRWRNGWSRLLPLQPLFQPSHGICHQTVSSFRNPASNRSGKCAWSSFVRLPALVTLAVAAFVISAPLYARTDIFNHPVLSWVGLSTVMPRSNDYVPLFPWFGAVLIGIAGARIFQRFGWLQLLAGGIRPQFLETPLTFIGRHSLAFYLIHQPVLIALVYAFSQLMPRHSLRRVRLSRSPASPHAFRMVANSYVGSSAAVSWRNWTRLNCSMTSSAARSTRRTTEPSRVSHKCALQCPILSRVDQVLTPSSARRSIQDSSIWSSSPSVSSISRRF